MTEETNCQKTTFHKHEVVGASMLYDFMKRMDCDQEDIEVGVLLVRHHQFRFYENTKDSTIKRWLLKLKEYWIFNALMKIRIADRAANPKNEGKPVLPSETVELVERISAMGLLLKEDLAVNENDLHKLNIPVNNKLWVDLLILVNQDSSKNTRRHLLKYLQRKYGDQE